MRIALQRINIDFAAFDRALPVAFAALFVVALSATVADLTWLLVPVAERPLPAGSPQPSGRVIAPAANTAADEMPNWHLFGLAVEKPATPVADAIPQEAPDTQLRLTLTGVYASDNPKRAWAIVSDAGGRDELYRIDSNLPGGAILKEVHPDRIILLRNSRYETLRLPEESVLGTTEQARNLDSRQSFGGGPSSRAQISPSAVVLLRDYKQKLESDPQSVMDALRAEPYRVGGEIKGYRIFPGRDKRLMGEVGLRPGDVVTAVNGIALDNPIKGLELMKQLPSVSEVSVEVLRNGVSQTLVVPVN